ncbi:MAG: class I SAM-dependent methyltransferase [Deltaproteobacteria bacterium]|nr:class I SAM-dependent methyltransferase [Deltaproteobacteria bacterium]
MLPTTYFPQHADNRMANEGNVAASRANFLQRRPSNLAFLLEQRYGWMNEYLTDASVAYELGCGAGFGKEFIRAKNFRLTDVVAQPWVELEVDALRMPFEPGSVDALVCSHMIHHLAFPKRFFAEAARVLKPGGVILISEIQTSFVMRLLLRLMRHEGWSYDVDVFGEARPANDPADPWSANCAIPQLLFQDPKKFEQQIPGFKVERNALTEFSIFPLSGGVIAKSKTIDLPRPVLRAFDLLDRALIALWPSMFAMGRRVVLRKTDARLH